MKFFRPLHNYIAFIFLSGIIVASFIYGVEENNVTVLLLSIIFGFLVAIHIDVIGETLKPCARDISKKHSEAIAFIPYGLIFIYFLIFYLFQRVLGFIMLLSLFSFIYILSYSIFKRYMEKDK